MLSGDLLPEQLRDDFFIVDLGDGSHQSLRSKTKGVRVVAILPRGVPDHEKAEALIAAVANRLAASELEYLKTA